MKKEPERRPSTVILLLLLPLIPTVLSASCNPLLVRCRTSEAIDTRILRDTLPAHLEPPQDDKARVVMETLLKIDTHYNAKQPELLRQSNAIDLFRAPNKLYDAQTEWDDESRLRFIIAVIAEESFKRLPEGSSRDSRGTLLEKMCPLREDEECSATDKFRTYDGVCNNVRHTDWGSAYTRFQRFLPSVYPNTTPGLPTHPQLPSARRVSTKLFRELPDQEISLTQLVPHLAHFVYADVVRLAKPRISTDGGARSLPCCDPNMKHPECTPIDVPANDTKHAGFVRCMPYARTISAPARACDLSERQQANLATSFLDGSIIYGSEPVLARKLRAQTGGLLMTSYSSSPDYSLPLEVQCTSGRAGCFLGGSSQVNFLPSISALHTVWLRQHNRIAKELQSLNPHWTDMLIYQEARRIVGAQLQHVVYNELAPVIIGREKWAEYKLKSETSGYASGYSTSVDPSALNSYAAVAGQFFYTMFSPKLANEDAQGRPMLQKLLSETFNEPSSLYVTENISGVLRFLAKRKTTRPGLHMTDELKNRMFKSVGNFGLDMAALLVETGRDHGIPSYTAWRERCGFAKVTAFHQLVNEFTDGAQTVSDMMDIYAAVEDVDLIVGGLAEHPLPGGLLGKTLTCIVGLQFQKMKVGDRFWYENGMAPAQFTEKQLMEIRKSSLARIICENGRLETIQPHALVEEDDFERKPRQQVSTTVGTALQDSPLVGCYSCVYGASATINYCTSTLREEVAVASCDDSSQFPLHCNPSTRTNVIQVSTTQPTPALVCHLVCPGGSSDFDLTGRLHPAPSIENERDPPVSTS